jgi:hypothetical protein
VHTCVPPTHPRRKSEGGKTKSEKKKKMNIMHRMCPQHIQRGGKKTRERDKKSTPCTGGPPQHMQEESEIGGKKNMVRKQRGKKKEKGKKK